MPVDVTALRDAQRPLRDRIRDFLAARPGKAFDLYEVYAAVEGYREESVVLIALVLAAKDGRMPPKLEEYERALNELVQEGILEAGEYKARVYYHATGEPP
jgi:hypothetical protein